MWIFAFLLQATAPCTPAPTPSGPPALVVQVVDPLWLPLPGAEVHVTTRRAAVQTQHTGAQGYAQIWVAAEADYDIEAQLVGFKTKRVKAVRLGKRSESSPTAYVQIQLPLAARGETVW
jgi:hypothetical protein